MAAVWPAILFLLIVGVTGLDVPQRRELQAQPATPFCFQNKQACTATSYINAATGEPLDPPAIFSTCEFRGSIWVSPLIDSPGFDVEVDPFNLAQVWTDQYTTLKTKEGYVVGKTSYSFSKDNKFLDSRYTLFCDDFETPGATFPSAACTCPAGKSCFKCWRVDTSIKSPARGAYYNSKVATVAGITQAACSSDEPLMKQIKLTTTKESRYPGPPRDISTVSTPVKDVAGLFGGSANQPTLLSPSKAMLFMVARVNVVPTCVAVDNTVADAPPVETPFGPSSVAWLSMETRSTSAKCFGGWTSVALQNGNNFNQSGPSAIPPCPYNGNLGSAFFASSLCFPSYNDAQSGAVPGATCY